MSKAAIIVIVIAVLVIIAAIVWYVMAFPSTTQAPAPVQTSVSQNSPAPSPAVSNGLPTSQSDVSDAALAQDINAIDAQVKNIAADSTNVDANVNNAPK